MGIIRAAAGAVGGTLADSWLEYITAGEMGPNTVMTKGVQVTRSKRGSNKKYTPGIISNGSRIEVGPNQMMLLVESGRIVDYTAEEGCYEVYLSSSPSMFNGELGDSIRESFERFRFGGQPGKSQYAYFINLQEIRGIRFGTRNALQYFDNFYNAELFVRYHGTYSIKIVDPMKFYMEVASRNASRLEFQDLSEQFNMEFLGALQSTIGQMSVDGVRISALPSKSMELSKYMATVLDEDWMQARGVDICSVGIASISYDDESKSLINMRNQGAMMSDSTIREGYVQGAVARGLQDAGSNTAGAGQAYMAMGMGMQNAGNFMATASANNNQQMQQQASARQNIWTCSCGTKNTGNFCTNCGNKKTQNDSGKWTCSCGTVNTGNFCINCGNRK
ncbi:MAG: SPFH domain-containing protein [Ruminococcus sp.]|nr:SPFH domain-containing protein [Ruminococcus sp.]